MSQTWHSDILHLAYAMLSENVSFECFKVGMHLQFTTGPSFPVDVKHTLASLVYVTCLASGNKMVHFCTFPSSVTSLLLKSMIHTKDDFLRLSLSISNSKNVYNSLGVRTLFRNVKITINTLVFSPTKNK